MVTYIPTLQFNDVDILLFADMVFTRIFLFSFLALQVLALGNHPNG